MKAIALAAGILALGTAVAVAHPCDGDARARAVPLLQLQYDMTDADLSIGDSVKALPPLKSLVGNGKFDVLEVWGYIYKAEYRMRFIYAQIPGTCVLMGQEILEASNPY